jgi:hypothetical protein
MRKTLATLIVTGLNKVNPLGNVIGEQRKMTMVVYHVVPFGSSHYCSSKLPRYKRPTQWIVKSHLRLFPTYVLHFEIRKEMSRELDVIAHLFNGHNIIAHEIHFVSCDSQSPSKRYCVAG